MLIPSDQEFFPIGQASRLTQVPAYVLRYWESEFKLLRPSRRESGQRKYSRADVETILKIKELLYVKRFTISGAKKALSATLRAAPEQMKIELEDTQAAARLLKETRQTLEEIVKILK